MTRGRGLQTQALSSFHEASADKFVVDDGDHDMSMGWRDGAVDQNEVAGLNPGLVHGVAGDSHEVGCLGVPDQQVIEVQPGDAGVLRWRAKADRDIRPRGNKLLARRTSDLNWLAGTAITGHIHSIPIRSSAQQGFCALQALAQWPAKSQALSLCGRPQQGQPRRYGKGSDDLCRHDGGQHFKRIEVPSGDQPPSGD